jgi:hypothetical protein
MNDRMKLDKLLALRKAVENLVNYDSTNPKASWRMDEFMASIGRSYLKTEES